ncbi:MAG: 6-phosphogluconolactonase [Chloroflexota bacterium]
MDIRVLDDAAAVADAGTALLCEWLAAKPDALVVAALGRSPQGVYAGIARAVDDGRLDLSRLRIAQLDNYLGPGPDDARSLVGWLQRDVLVPWRIPAEHVTWLPGDEPDPAETCATYARSVATAGGFDVSVLGVGPSGHLGFNEPPSPPDAPTRVVELTAESRASSATYWRTGLEVPSHGITCGMDLLLGARRTLVVITGDKKRAIVRRMLSEPISPDVPASLLRSIEGVTLLVDRAAWGDMPSPGDLES